MTMSLTVRKSSPVVVKPSDPAVTMSSTIKLSSFDKDMIGISVTSFFVFDQPIQEPAETIKKALSQAMVHYYPISGRVAAVADDDVEPHIQCTGEGVLFVTASASSTLKQVNFLEQSPGAKALLDELALYYDDDPAAWGCGGSSDPLMMMQVTEFSCGGFVVGVTWNHAIADGYGMAQFLGAVGEMARGLSPPSVVPIRWDDSLPSLPPSNVALQQLLPTLEPMDFACVDITIPSSAINRIKAEYRSSSAGGQSSCTVFEVVAAVLWRCRTRAIMSNPEAPAVLFFTVNLRKHVGAKDGYYGNCAAGQLVVATSGTVVNGDIIDVISLIKRTKDQIPHRFKQGGGRITASSNSQPQAVRPQHLDREAAGYGILVLSSWRNLGFEEPDFGGGNPAMVMFHTKQTTSPVPHCVTCLPWKGIDGVNLLSRCVKKEHANAFLAELSRFL